MSDFLYVAGTLRNPAQKFDPKIIEICGLEISPRIVRECKKGNFYNANFVRLHLMFRERVFANPDLV